MTDDEQPYIDRWPMFEEAYSKFLVLADVAHARKKGGHIKARVEFNGKWFTPDDPEWFADFPR